MWDFFILLTTILNKGVGELFRVRGCFWEIMSLWKILQGRTGGYRVLGYATFISGILDRESSVANQASRTVLPEPGFTFQASRTMRQELAVVMPIS